MIVLRKGAIDLTEDDKDIILTSLIHYAWHCYHNGLYALDSMENISKLYSELHNVWKNDNADMTHNI